MTSRITVAAVSAAVKYNKIPLITRKWTKWDSQDVDNRQLCGACALSQIALATGCQFVEGNMYEVVSKHMGLSVNYVDGFTGGFDGIDRMYPEGKYPVFDIGYTDGLAVHKYFFPEEVME